MRQFRDRLQDILDASALIQVWMVHHLMIM